MPCEFLRPMRKLCIGQPQPFEVRLLWRSGVLQRALHLRDPSSSLYLGSIFAPSRLHLGWISAPSPLHLRLSICATQSSFHESRLSERTFVVGERGLKVRVDREGRWWGGGGVAGWRGGACTQVSRWRRGEGEL